ncbi:MAG: phosphatidate cytidylyltransferase [Eubacteriales bacterium]
MKQRIATGSVILLGLLLLLFLSDTLLWPLSCVLLSLAGNFEFLKVMGVQKKPAYSVPAYLLALAVPLLALACTMAEVPVTVCIVFVFFVLQVWMLYLFAVAVLARGKTPFAEVASVYLGTLYIILSAVSLYLLRQREAGLLAVLPVFIGAWSTDTCAYFSGRFFGRHKLIPEVSPKKTVEGSVGGTVCCVAAFALYGLLVGVLTDDFTPNYPVLLLWGLLAAVLAQLGDLLMSLIKREHGVKDFGTLFPGHGGVLDRFDSILAIAPICLMLSLLPEPWSLFF